MENRLWVTPNNDLEAKTIVEMLQREGEDFLVTSQAWGASWENLEDEIKTKIEEAKRKQKTVYGVELQGDSNGAINVDHHIYGKYDNLLITSADGETNFYGTTEIIQMLNEKFPGGWSGGQLDQGSGFWGGYADQSAIKAAVQESLQKKLDDKEMRI